MQEAKLQITNSDITSPVLPFRFLQTWAFNMTTILFLTVTIPDDRCEGQRSRHGKFHASRAKLSIEGHNEDLIDQNMFGIEGAKLYGKSPRRKQGRFLH
jgi:hypothetical protein